MDKSFDFGRILRVNQKQKPAHFGNVSCGVKKRLGDSIRNRKSVRTTQFDIFRQLSNSESPQPVNASSELSKIEQRRLQLEKWKKEKEKKKKEAAAQKKKPFVTGVAHHPLNFVPPPPSKPSTVCRVTHSQSARLQNAINRVEQSFAPKNAKFKAPVLEDIPKLVPVTQKIKVNKVNYVFNPIIPSTSNQSNIIATKQTETHSGTKRNSKKAPTKKTTAKVMKKQNLKANVTHKNFTSSSSSETDTDNEHRISPNISPSSEEEMIHTAKSPTTKKRTPHKSLAKGKQVVTPKIPVLKSESSSEEKLKVSKSPVVVKMTLEPITKEASKTSPCVTMSRRKDNARREMKKKIEEGQFHEDDIDSVKLFRSQLNSEINKINEMCEVWDKIQEHTKLPESIEEVARGAVGQARLLVSQKFQQFATLLERCAHPEPDAALVTPADLQGFWDMVFMQVVDIDMRFKKLETLRQHNWQEEQPVVAKQKAAPKKPSRKPAKPAAASSRLREMIAAARKAKQQQPATPEKPQSPQGSRTFEAGFFSVVSPMRSPMNATPARRSMLQTVLSSEAKKSSLKPASFAILRASVLSKSMEHPGIAPLPQTPVNINATPGRSILKSAGAANNPGKKSIKMVMFDDCGDNKENSQEKDEERGAGVDGVDVLAAADTGVPSMDVDKENRSKRRPKLVRMNAVDECSPVQTRSRRKSADTPKAEDCGPGQSRSRRKSADTPKAEDCGSG